MGKFKDLTGQRFGRLTVIERVKEDTRHVKWRCLCDCGKETIVYSGNLQRGHTKSCGCYMIEINRENKKKYNTYDISGTYGVGFASNTWNKFYFDLDDYELINKYCWCENQMGIW